jgi:hypothetical protein
MKIEIVVDRRIERLYEEYMTFIESLRVKTKDFTLTLRRQFIWRTS